MEQRGWIERTNTFPEEWRDTRRITDKGRQAFSEMNYLKTSAQRGEYDPHHDEANKRVDAARRQYFSSKQRSFSPNMLFNQALKGIAKVHPGAAVMIDILLDWQVDENIPEKEYQQMIAVIERVIQNNPRLVLATEELAKKLTSDEEVNQIASGAYGSVPKKYGPLGKLVDEFLLKVRSATPEV